MQSIGESCDREIKSMVSGGSPRSVVSPVRFGTSGINKDPTYGLHALEKELLSDLNILDN